MHAYLKTKTKRRRKVNTIAGSVQAADEPPTKLMGPIAEKRMSQRVISTWVGLMLPAVCSDSSFVSYDMRQLVGNLNRGKEELHATHRKIAGGMWLRMTSLAFWRVDFRRCAGVGRDAQAPLKRGHDAENGGNYGRLSDPIGLLRLADCFATCDRMERSRGVDNFPERWRVAALRAERKS